MPRINPSKNNLNELVFKRLEEMDKKLSQLLQDKQKESKITERNEIVITKGQMNRAENVIEDWLAELEGDVIAELDFIDKTTFGYLDCIPKKCGIRIITSNPKKFDKCIIKAEKCGRDRPHFEIIRINKVHQRWIGSKDSFIIEIGTDLKTDSLGHSTHSIRKHPPNHFEESISHFEMLWEKSENELKKIFGDSLSKKKIYPK